MEYRNCAILTLSKKLPISQPAHEREGKEEEEEEEEEEIYLPYYCCSCCSCFYKKEIRVGKNKRDRYIWLLSEDESQVGTYLKWCQKLSGVF